MLSALTVVAATESEPAISPYVIGGGVLLLLLLLLAAVVAFGGGREHS